MSCRGHREARILWADIHDPISEGQVIHHVDGNPMNNDVGNLRMLGRGFHTHIHQKGGEYGYQERLDFKAAEIQCNQCGYSWEPRVEKPVACPRCTRYDWNEAKK